MNLRIFVDVVKITIEEIKECRKQSLQANTNLEKWKYASLLMMNILFLPVYLIPVIYSIVIICSSFLYGPITLLGLVLCIPFIIFVGLIKAKVYPVMKENYLNGASVKR